MVLSEVIVVVVGDAKQGKVSANWIMDEFSGALNTTNPTQVNELMKKLIG